MAKMKKKNNNYGGKAPAAKQPSAQPSVQIFQYGLPGWLVAVCLLMLGGALLLQSRVEGAGVLATVTYLLTGVPALILGYGQKKVKEENGSKMASALFLLFTVIAVIYLFAGITSLGDLLRS